MTTPARPAPRPAPRPARRAASKQLALTLPRRPSWGGKRQGAGRKPRVPGRPGVPHRPREPLASRFPVHVTLRVDETLPSLRSPTLRPVIEGCFRAANRAADRAAVGWRIAHYSVQRHHLHLVVEAVDAARLSRGMQGLCIRLARRLNAALARRGRVFVDRYFPRILRTARQVHACLRYVLLNARRHDAQRGRVRDAGWLDPCSSALWFDGWRTAVQPPAGSAPPVAAPKTWLLASGWRRHGLLDAGDVPGSVPRARPRRAARPAS